jgi:succinoglycan biosynthesis protein ExoM
MPEPVRVLLVALTYKRPQDLAELLPMLAGQADRAADDVHVLIVDNDPAAGARDQVAAFGRGVTYLHAETPGIAAARNAALEASDGFDLLVFIDDDERPVDGWLDLMLGTWHETRAQAVIGPVVSSFAVEPDEWVQAGRFFDRRRMPTGTETAVAATNNLLLDLAFVRANALRFDLRFGLTGGSDTLFTRQLHAAGGRMVWNDEAVVTDVVPPQRVTRRWVLQRAFRSGNSWATTSVAIARSPLHRASTRLSLLAQGTPRLIAGAGALGLGSVSRRLALRARGTRTAARGAGMLSGAFGVAYVEYKRPSTTV